MRCKRWQRLQFLRILFFWNMMLHYDVQLCLCTGPLHLHSIVQVQHINSNNHKNWQHTHIHYKVLAGTCHKVCSI
jgi:hypothetical protein